MRRILIILIFIGLHVSQAQGQNVGNEWIDFNQTYYKIPVAQEGIYRISYDDLVAAGFPLATTDARKIQLFHRGVEQAIEIVGEGDARIDPGDYIEFYGQRNDGTLDVGLYESPGDQPHNYYNLYSDTTVYYLTNTFGPDFGKRITPEFFKNNTGGLPEESYHLAQNTQLKTTSYSEGFTSLNHTNRTSFDLGEGWTGTLINEGSATNWDDTLLPGASNLVTSSAKPVIEMVIVGRNNRIHRIRILVGPNSSSLRELNTYVLENYNSLTVSEEIEWSDLAVNGDLLVRTEVVKDFGGISLASVSYANLIYPRDFDIDGAQSGILHLEANPGGESFIRIRNVPGSITLYDITDRNNIVRTGYVEDGADITAVIPNTESGKVVYYNGAGFIQPSSITALTFRNITPTSHDYLIVSHKDLMQPAGNSTNAVRSYAEYRASADGGSYDTLVIPMQELYDQFSYGEKTPLSIYNFAKFMFDNGSPQHLLLIGKGLNLKNQFHRSNPQLFDYKDLVPTAGSPGADMTFTARLGSDPNVPAISTGRITASTPQDVLNYLEKVEDYERQTFDELWKKRLLHLSGGISASELVLFRNYMDGFASVAASDYLGGETTTVQKETNTISAEINVADVINEGVNLVTFFGHSAPDVTDIDIGFVTDDNFGYNNPLRYPTFLMNGCNAGAIFNNDLIFGEDWVLAEDRGAIGFIAHSSFGFDFNLRRYSDKFYEVAFGDSLFINKSIGEIQIETAKRYLAENSPTAIVNVAQAQQMVLMGDPAIHLFAADKPDYHASDSNLFLESFDGSPVNALADSIKLGVIIRNFGRTNADSTIIALQRTFGGTNVEMDTIKIAPVLFQDTAYITIQLEALSSFGSNSFEVLLDADNQVEELNELNNIGRLEFFIPLNATSNLFPVNFSVVSTQNVSLITQSSNLVNGLRDLEFEIDTAATFSSPFRQSTVIENSIVGTWNVQLIDPTLQDSVVYYWRTRFSNPQPGESTDWAESSFFYINNGPSGWAQADFPQFDDNQTTGLNRNPGNKSWAFKQNQLTVSLQTYGANNTEQILDLKVDNTQLIITTDPNRACREDAINGIAFDKATLSPYAPLSDLELGIPPAAPATCGVQPQVINNFTNAEITGGQLIALIDEVETGDKFLFYSLGNVQYTLWDATIKQKLGEVGATMATLDALADGQPYILLGEKGAAPGSALEITGADTEAIQLNETLSGSFTSGTITSPLIGPATTWESFNYSVESSGSDSFNFDLIGIAADGTRQVVNSDVTTNSLDLSFVDASAYPRLQMEADLTDDTDLTVPQLARWQINFQSPPDGLLFFAGNSVDGSLAVEIEEGQQLQTTFGYVNLSEIDFTDSLVVQYNTTNLTDRTVESGLFKIAPVNANDTTEFTIDINTIAKVGPNDLQVSVNPNGVLEQYQFNNGLSLSNYFTVNPDQTNPLLDVVFDGEYILDGDIVSPSPLVSIKLLDENELILKQDTSDFTISLKQVCEGCQFERISFSSPEVQWQPATTDSDFAVQYQPIQLSDGLYTLRVQASDASGNRAGANPYEINFRVVNEATITNFYPYPNPFSTSTRFIFTLTGSEIPQQVKIQIMTISGKIVREITQDELGPLRIGNNVSDFAWDGKDEFGDQLANGVYLYRVQIAGSSSLTNRQTSADKAFKNGYGKIYLLK